jgi:hypothetical protein
MSDGLTPRNTAQPASTTQVPQNPPSAPTPPATNTVPPPRPQRSNRRGAPIAKAAAVPFSGSGSGTLDPLIQACDEVSLLPHERDDESFWLPDANHLYAVLHQMDTQMYTTKRFLDNAQAFLAQLTSAFYGVVWYVHNLRAQSTCSSFPDEYRLFLEWFEKTYDLKTIPIPGPIIPFFKTATNVEGPSERYGSIYPFIPTEDELNVLQSRHYEINAPFRHHLPNVILALDQIRRFGSFQQEIVAADPAKTPPVTQVTRPSSNYVLYSNIYGETASDTANKRWMMASPNAVDNKHPPVGVRAQAHGYWQRAFESIPQYDATTGNLTTRLSIYQILGFRGVTTTTRGKYYDWFAKSIPVFQQYCKHWKSSINMYQLQITGLGAGTIRLEAEDNGDATNFFFPATIRTVTEYMPCRHRGLQDDHIDHEVVRYSRDPLSSKLFFTASNSFEEFDKTAVQYALTTIVNMSLYRVTPNTGWTAETAATVRKGPYWEKDYEHRTTQHNVVGRYNGYLFGSYYSAVPI